MKCLIFPTFLLLLSSFAATAAGPYGGSWEERTQYQLKLMKKRYADYFKRIEEREKWEKKRKSGTSALRKKRQAEIDRYEKGRLKQIEARKNRKIEKWASEKAYRDYLLSLENDEKKRKKSRGKYIKGRKYMEAQLKKADKRLTDYQEYGLDYEAVEPEAE